MQSEWDNGYEEDWRDEDWGAGDDEPADTFPCGNCGADVYEESEQCPHCGEWVTHSTSPLAGRPLWWQLMGLFGIIAVILALLQ